MKTMQKTKFNRFNKKGMSVQTIESADITPTKRISPQQKQFFFGPNKSSQTMMKNLIQSTRLKQLVEENLKLLQESSEKDLQIGKLYSQVDTDNSIRTQRVQTLNNISQNQNNKILSNRCKPQQINENTQKEDKLLFTFYSPEQKQSSQVFKLPNVFKLTPNQKKYFI